VRFGAAAAGFCVPPNRTSQSVQTKVGRDLPRGARCKQPTRRHASRKAALTRRQPSGSSRLEDVESIESGHRSSNDPAAPTRAPFERAPGRPDGHNRDTRSGPDVRAAGVAPGPQADRLVPARARARAPRADLPPRRDLEHRHACRHGDDRRGGGRAIAVVVLLLVVNGVVANGDQIKTLVSSAVDKVEGGQTMPVWRARPAPARVGAGIRF
jgi:hypothetical protein